MSMKASQVVLCGFLLGVTWIGSIWEGAETFRPSSWGLWSVGILLLVLAGDLALRWMQARRLRACLVPVRVQVGPGKRP